MGMIFFWVSQAGTDGNVQYIDYVKCCANCWHPINVCNKYIFYVKNCVHPSEIGFSLYLPIFVAPSVIIHPLSKRASLLLDFTLYNLLLPNVIYVKKDCVI